MRDFRFLAKHATPEHEPVTDSLCPVTKIDAFTGGGAPLGHLSVTEEDRPTDLGLVHHVRFNDCMAVKLLERFTQWAQGHDDLQPDVVQTLADLKRNYLGDAREDRWRAGDLSELLLDLLPAKVSADDTWYDAVLPTLRAFLRFAHSEGLLHRGSAPVSALLTELDGVEEEFGGAVHDPSRFGLGKSIMSAMGLTELSDPVAVEEAVSRFNALPERARRAITDPAVGGRLGMLPGADGSPTDLTDLDDEFDDVFDEEFDDVLDEVEPQLPLVRLAPLTELGDAARRSRTWGRVATLTEWVGEGRRLTTRHVLRLPEARAVCSRLGIRPVPDWANQPWLDRDGLRAQGVAESDLPPLPEPPLRSAADIDALNRVWLLAVHGGWIEVTDRRATRGPAWEASLVGKAEQDLALWTSLFTAALEMGITGADSRRYPVTDDRPSAAVLHALMSAYVGDLHTLDGLLDEILQGQDDLLDEESVDQETTDMLRRIEGRRLRAHLARLADLGAVELGDDGTVALTPLGVWGMHRQLSSIGIAAPALGDVTAMDARELLLCSERLLVEDAEAVRTEWIAARGRRQAATALLDTAREGSAMLRLAVVSMLDDDLPDLLDEVARPYLSDPLLGRHLRSLMAQHGLGAGAPLTEDDRRWLAVESLAAHVETVRPPVEEEDLPDDAWIVAEGALDLRTAWKIDHPQILDVLDAIGSGHPRGPVRTAAHKAARKARMSGRA